MASTKFSSATRGLRRGQLLSTTVLGGLALTLPGTSSYAQTMVTDGTLVVSSSAQLSGTVTVDNALGRNAMLQINAGVSIGNQVILKNGGSLNNSGTVSRTGSSQRAVESTTGGATVNNTGGKLSATGSNGVGVLISNSIGTVSNQNGGIIEGREAGIWLTGGGTVLNTGAGSVISAGANATLGYGVYATSAPVPVTVTNKAGASIAGKTAGIYLGVGGTVTNDGAASKISSDAAGSVGVSIGGTSSTATGIVNNTGGATILGVGGGVTLYNGGEVFNGAGSVIKANTAVIVISGNTKLTNEGQLVGNVNLNFQGAAKTHQVTLVTGSSITGNLGIGNNVASTLTLDGLGDQLYSKAVTGSTAFTGTLVKQGLGTWTLDQTQNGLTTGNTRIEGGTLNINTRLASARVDVLSGATLTGSGKLDGTVQFLSDEDGKGGILAGVQGRTLTIGGNLVLDAGSSVDVTLGAAASTPAMAAALFTVGGNLILDGTLNVTDNGGFGPGVYRLFDYGGTLTNNGLAIGTTPAGSIADNFAVQTSVNHQVNLVSSLGVELSFWDGGDTTLHGNQAIDGGDGGWRADGHNWTDVAGTLNGPYQPNPTFAVFQGTAGTVTVDSTAGAIAATGMQFATDGYSVEGDGITLQELGGKSILRVGDNTADGASMTATIASALGGATQLIKSDLGTLVLTGTNTYTGGTELQAGTLSVSADANLGAATGSLAFTGGTLATTAGFDTSRAVTLTQSGRFDAADDTTLGLTGAVSGSGNLVKTGAGTLRLDNAGNAYGDTLVEAGTLIGNAGSISGKIGNAGTVVFSQAADASFAGNILGLNDTDGQMIKRGVGTLTLAGTSALDWSIEAGGLTTAAQRFSGNAAIGEDGALTFNQAANAVDASYAGGLSGVGDFIKAGSGVLTLDGDSSAFAGTTSVTAGKLIVGSDTSHATAALGGSLTVKQDATLAGHGTVGSGAGSVVTIASGGTLAPGNSMGTLTIDGDLTFANGSRYVVEVDPAGTTSDLVHVTGDAILNGGAVAHIGADGNYKLRSSYTILSVDGKLTGAFDSVTSNYAYLTPDLAYDYGASTVDLTLKRNNVDFASSALTRNQITTANALDSIGIDAANPLYDAIALLPDDEALARSSFDALSGEIHASAKTALIDDSRFVREAATDRIRAAFEGVGAASMPVMAYGEVGPVLAPAITDRVAVWGQGFGAWGHTDGDGNAVRLNRSTGGLLMGADGQVFDAWRLGLIAGYSRTSFDVKDRHSSGSSDNYYLGLYGGTQWGSLGFRGGSAYTWHDVSTSRSVAFPGFADSLKGSYNAGTFQAFGELGHRIDTQMASFEPFANLAYVNLNTGGFTEQGGLAALSAGSQSSDTTFTTLGLHASTSFALGVINATARGVLGWKHAFNDVTPLSKQAFAGSDTFTIAGVPIVRDSVLIEAGLDLDLSPAATFGLSYNGQIAAGAQQHGFKANLAVRF